MLILFNNFFKNFHGVTWGEVEKVAMNSRGILNVL